MVGQGRKWLYYLIDTGGKSYRIENGIVLAKANRRPLRYTPSGWQDIAIGWERDLQKYGLIRKFTLPLDFILDGADILRALFYTKNFEEKVYLLIQKEKLVLTPTEFYFLHDLFYKGLLDLSKGEDSEEKFTVSVEEESLAQAIQANENTVFEIKINVPEAIAIKYDGLELLAEGKFAIVNVTPASAAITDYDTRNHFVPLLDVTNDTGSRISMKGIDRVKFTGTNADLPGNENWFFYASVDTELKLKWNFKVGAARIDPSITLDPSGRTSIQFQVVRNGVVDTTSSVSVFFGLLPATGQVFTGNATINIKKGDTVFFRTFFTTIGATGDANIRYTYFDIQDSMLEVSGKYLYDVSYRKGLRPAYVAQQLINKMTKTTGKYLFSSSILTNEWDNLVLTSGDGLRGFTDAVIKTKWSDFVKSYDSVLCLSIAITPKAVSLEARAANFSTSDQIALGKVKESKVKYADNLLITKLKAGYPPQTYDNLNGRFEFNTTLQFSSVVTKTSNEYDMVSEYRGDGLGMELARTGLDGKVTTDSSSDNDVFMVHVDKDNTGLGFLADNTPVYKLYRRAYNSMTGILTSKPINLEISPKRNIERHRAWINSLLYGFEGTFLKFESSDKSAALHTVLNGVHVEERADIEITRAPRIFKPFTFDFKPMTPSELVETLETNANRCFNFEHYNGKTYSGFPLNIGIAANSLQEQAFLLLSTDDNDITTLK